MSKHNAAAGAQYYPDGLRKVATPQALSSTTALLNDATAQTPLWKDSDSIIQIERKDL